MLAPGSVLDERAYSDDPAAQAVVRGGKPYEMVDDTSPVPLPGWLAELADPRPAARQQARRNDRPVPQGAPGRRLDAIVAKVRASQPGDRTGPLVWAAFRVREMAEAGEVDDAEAAEQLVEAAVAAGIRGGESYARQQVLGVLGVTR